jgi:hypothetical protein
MTDITISLPHKALIPLAASRPNQQFLALLYDEIDANDISVRSTRGTRTLGRLALTLSAANYTATVGGVFVFDPPTHTGYIPVPLNKEWGLAEITENIRRFIANSASYKRYCVTAAALNSQRIVAVPNTFINTIQIIGLGYATLSALDILSHIDTEYGEVSTKDLNNNIRLINRPPANP